MGRWTKGEFDQIHLRGMPLQVVLFPPTRWRRHTPPASPALQRIKQVRLSLGPGTQCQYPKSLALMQFS